MAQLSAARVCSNCDLQDLVNVKESLGGFSNRETHIVELGITTAILWEKWFSYILIDNVFISQNCLSLQSLQMLRMVRTKLYDFTTQYFPMVSAGTGLSVLLQSDGTATAFGLNSPGSGDLPPLTEGVAYIQTSAALGYIAFLRSWVMVWDIWSTHFCGIGLVIRVRFLSSSVGPILEFFTMVWLKIETTRKWRYSLGCENVWKTTIWRVQHSTLGCGRVLHPSCCRWVP